MRAKPILSLTLLAAALALPGTAASVGLGKMTLQSSLGQPLSAQIELTSVTNEDLGTVTARIADSSLYRQNSLTYQSVLSRARVAVERLPNGEAVLKVTTSSSVVEPYLDLLVEVNWASGRVVRAYTFLLDPPGMPAAPAIEPVTPPAVGAGRSLALRRPAATARPPRERGFRRRRSVRQQLYRPARRHAVADRRRRKAARCNARADAGRALQQQSVRVRRQHESTARRRDPQHSERRAGRGNATGRSRENRAPPGLRIGAAIRTRSREPRRRRKAPALASRAERSGRPSKKRFRPLRRVAISSRCRRRRARARRDSSGGRGRIARQGAEGSADAHQRPREDAEGSAEGARAQGTARRRPSGAGRQGAGTGEGRAAQSEPPTAGVPAPGMKAPEPPKVDRPRSSPRRPRHPK